MFCCNKCIKSEFSWKAIYLSNIKWHNQPPTCEKGRVIFVKNLCVFGASCSNIDSEFLNAAYTLGQVMAQRGIGLVLAAAIPALWARLPAAYMTAAAG